MIEIKNLKKIFNENVVLNDVNLIIPDNSIFGLIGINGSGKSTLLRIMASIYKPNEGSIMFDGMSIDTYSKLKELVFFLPDDPYYNNFVTPMSVIKIYKAFYPRFDMDTYVHYLSMFELEKNKKIITFSKGMKIKLFICIALACKVKYVLLDEAFDGLDPIARSLFKKILSNISNNNDITIVLSSHSLNDLEDVVDTFAIIHEQKVLVNGKTNDEIDKFVKYQLAYDHYIKAEDFKYLKPISLEINGRVIEIVLRNNEAIDLLDEISKTNPVFIQEENIDFEDFFNTLIKKEGCHYE